LTTGSAGLNSTQQLASHERCGVVAIIVVRGFTPQSELHRRDQYQAEIRPEFFMNGSESAFVHGELCNTCEGDTWWPWCTKNPVAFHLERPEVKQRPCHPKGLQLRQNL